MSKYAGFLTLALLSGAAVFLGAGPAEAQFRGFQPRGIHGPVYPPNRMPGWDWWRTYPWSPYNYGRNPYNPIRYPYLSPYPVYTPYAVPVYGPTVPAYATPGAADSRQQVLVPHPTGQLKAPPPNAAVIRLAVPDPFAEVWFNGTETTSSGTTRYYVTPGLNGAKYHYEVTARWRRAGQPVTETRQLEVSPGKTAVVDFTSKSP